MDPTQRPDDGEYPIKFLIVIPSFVAYMSMGNNGFEISEDYDKNIIIPKC
jgi:hypothetical protein